MAGDFIRLANDEEGRDVLFTLPWHGDWPPPEKLEPFGEGWGMWRRCTYSQLPANFSEHVARGAIYVPDTADSLEDPPQECSTPGGDASTS